MPAEPDDPKSKREYVDLRLPRAGADGHGDGTGAASEDPDVGTRQRIIEAAAEVFLEKGFTGTRVVDIARRAGFTSGALYSYFDSRAELLAEAVARGSSEMLSRLLSAGAQDPDGEHPTAPGAPEPLAVLERTLDQIAEPLDASDQMLLDGVALAHREPVAGDRLADALAHFRGQLQTTDGGELAPGAADLLVVLVLGVTAARALGLHDPLPEALHRQVADCLGALGR